MNLTAENLFWNSNGYIGLANYLDNEFKDVAANLDFLNDSIQHRLWILLLTLSKITIYKGQNKNILTNFLNKIIEQVESK